MEEKQRKSNVGGSTKFPEVTTGGSNILFDVTTASNATIDVRVSAEIDVSLSPDKATLMWVSCSSSE